MISHFKKDQTENNLLRSYIRSESVVFYKTKEDFGGLSNMASGYPLEINGIKILTTEALYQACRFPHMPEIQREIIEQRSPMTAKMKSKPHRKISRSDWDYVRHKIMRWCLRVKLAQNYENFSRLIISTKDQPIVEQSRKDTYWGAKLADEAGSTLIGQNVLGRLLMELREQIRDDKEDLLKIVPPLDIPDFLLLGDPIAIVSSFRNSGNRQNQKHQSALF